jgi:hypothetical protein
MRNEFGIDISSLRSDAGATVDHGAAYAGAAQPLEDLQDGSWGDDLLVAPFVREHAMAMALAVEAHRMLGATIGEVGNGMVDMAQTTADADASALESKTATAGETWT